MSQAAGVGGPDRFHGSAQDSGQVHQAGRDQHIHYFYEGASLEAAYAGILARGAAAGKTHERVSLLVEALSATVVQCKARCVELEEDARQARAAGRREALAEFQEQLRESELQVIRAQRVMREALEERNRAEALRMSAQQEAAELRRAQERLREESFRREAAAEYEIGQVRADERRRQKESFTELMDEAEVQLTRVRDELTHLSQEVAQRSSQPEPNVLEGQLIETPAESRPRPAATLTAQTTGVASPPPQPSTLEGAVPHDTRAPRSRQRAPGPRRPWRITFFSAVCVIPLCIPPIAVTSLRTAYASDGEIWQAALFTLCTVVIVVVLLALCTFFLLLASEALGRQSEESAELTGIVVTVVGLPITLVVGFFTPLDWPGPAGAWGHAVATWVGLSP